MGDTMMLLQRGENWQAIYRKAEACVDTKERIRRLNQAYEQRLWQAGGATARHLLAQWWGEVQAI